jgi:hypothetical protein
MSQVTADPLEVVIRGAGEGWLIDWFAPKDDAVLHLRNRLAAADEASQSRFGANGPRFSPEDIGAEYNENPNKVRAFLQALGSIDSPDFLVMVWRILQRMTIQSIRMEYEAQQHFALRIALRSPYGEPDEDYQTGDIDDAVVLRHLGALKTDGRPVFDGFYPLNLMT